MPVTADTSADAAAELMRTERAGASDPAQTLCGADAHDLRAGLAELHAHLLRTEEATKQWGERSRHRTHRLLAERLMRITAAKPATGL
jgi:hypothetical protein